MIGALFYYVYHSWRNRLRIRLARLRQPKYLFGGIVGGAYIWFFFIRQMFMGRGLRVSASPFSGDFSAVAEFIGAFILLVLTIAAWVFPNERSSMAFSEAEVSFLFPAPVSRKTLIHFKLARSQMAIFFSALIFSVISARTGGSLFLVRAIGWWTVLSIANLHLLGSSFTMTMLMDRGISALWRRVVVLGVAALALGGIAFWGWTTFPEASLADIKSVETATAYLRHVMESGPLPYLLYPFRLIVRPFFSHTLSEALIALGPALAIMAAHYFWVVRMDVSFEEASLAASQKLAERIAAIRSGNWQAANSKQKPRSEPFKLKPVGAPAVAIIWKNIISAGSLFTGRFFVIISIYVLTLSTGLGLALGHRHGLAGSIGMVGAILLGFSLFMGPALLRQDLRQDLLATDILKQYPVPGWQIVLGEILAPVIILSAIQWILILAIVCLWPDQLGSFQVSLGMRVATGLGAAVFFPAFNMVNLTLSNATVLIFPAWFQHGKETMRGIENMGQQMILMLGRLLTMAASLIPAGLLFVGFLALGYYTVGIAPGILVGSLAAVAAFGAEIWLAVRHLGKRFDAFDLSAELSERA